MKKINLVLSSLLFIAFFAACSSSDGDNQAPAIKLIAPAEGAKLQIGKDVHFDMEVADNEKVASYKVDIHNNFDNHQHSRANKEEKPFSFNKSWPVNKKQAKIHHHEIVIPEGVKAGNYHLMVFVTDEAGNESHVTRNIVLVTEGGEDHHHHHEGE